MSRLSHHPQHGPPDDAELDHLLGKLAAEPVPAVAREAAASLPAFFSAPRTFEQDTARRAYLTWSLAFAPVAAACVCAAALQCLQLRDSALASPHTAALLLAILG